MSKPSHIARCQISFIGGAVNFCLQKSRMLFGGLVRSPFFFCWGKVLQYNNFGLQTVENCWCWSDFSIICWSHFYLFCWTYSFLLLGSQNLYVQQNFHHKREKVTPTPTVLTVGEPKMLGPTKVIKVRWLLTHQISLLWWAISRTMPISWVVSFRQGKCKHVWNLVL